MTAIVVLVTLLLALTASGATAAAEECATFTRSTQPLPPLVRAWFAHSADERVLVCPQPPPPGGEAGAPLYVGEGAVTQRGAVCSYLSHGLKLAGSGADARLQRYEHTEALAMAPAGSDCPRPEARAGERYVDTYDVSPAAFLGIMRLWTTTVTASALPGSGTRPTAAAGIVRRAVAPDADAARGAAAGDTRARLVAAIGPGRISGASLRRIVRLPGSLLRHRYAVFVRVPDAAAGSASLYVLYIEKGLRGPYEIASFAETN